jgi:hypothetical protein
MHTEFHREKEYGAARKAFRLVRLSLARSANKIYVVKLCVR